MPPWKPSSMVRAALSSSRALPWRSSWRVGSPSISFCSCREAPLADTHPDPMQRPLPDGTVPAEEVARTEKHWLAAMLTLLGVMMAVVVGAGAINAIHPPSNVETIDPV